MTRALAFVDLDDTLFQTRRKCPPEWREDQLKALAYDRDGAPLSFTTPRQQAFLDWLLAGADVIPVTARSREALGRVRLRSGRAVCAHGGVVLDASGAVVTGWREAIATDAALTEPALTELRARADTLANKHGAVRTRILHEDGIPLYLLLKPVGECERALAATVGELKGEVPQGWTVHHNGSNAALLPPHLGKARAVAHVLDELRRERPDAPVLGIGDSFTDAPFMQLCDYAVTPAGSQLSARLLQGEGS